jgi:hypothetical protein
MRPTFQSFAVPLPAQSARIAQLIEHFEPSSIPGQLHNSPQLRGDAETYPRLNTTAVHD